MGPPPVTWGGTAQHLPLFSVTAQLTLSLQPDSRTHFNTFLTTVFCDTLTYIKRAVMGKP